MSEIKIISCFLLIFFNFNSLQASPNYPVVPVEISIDNLDEFPNIKLIGLKKDLDRGEVRKKIFQKNKSGVTLSSSNEQLEIYAVSDFLLQKSGLMNLRLVNDRNVVMYLFKIKAGKKDERSCQKDVLKRRLFYRIVGFNHHSLILKKSKEISTMSDRTERESVFTEEFQDNALFVDINDAVQDDEFPYIFYLYQEQKEKAIHLEFKGDYIGEFRIDLIDQYGDVKTQRMINKVQKEWVGIIPTKSLQPGKYQIRVFRNKMLEKRVFVIH